MSETKTSQAQHSEKTTGAATPPFAPFMPFGAMPGFDPAAFLGMATFWQKAAAEQHGRFVAMLEEAAKLEERSAAEARKAVEEMSRLTLASIDYARETSANFRKAALELSQRVAEAQADAAKTAAPKAN